jgi:hypothetical protein
MLHSTRYKHRWLSIVVDVAGRSGSMIRVNPRTYSVIWGLIIVILGTGWAIYGFLGGGETFLTTIVVLSIILFGVAIIFIERRST